MLSKLFYYLSPNFTMANENQQQRDGDTNTLDYWRGRCESLEKRFADLVASTNNPANQVEENVPAICSPPSPIIPADFISSFKDEIDQVKKGLADLEVSNNVRFQAVSEEIANDRQYTRRNSILVHGYDSLPHISTFDFVKETVVELNNLFPSFNSLFHIDTAHPLATKKQGTKKIVLIKFKNRWLKAEILRRYLGKPLGKPGLKVTEHLTAYTRELKASAEKLVGQNNVSVDDCVVYAEVNGKQYPVKYSCDLDLLNDIVSNSAPAPTSSQDNPSTTSSTLAPCSSGSNSIPLGSRFCIPQNTTEYEQKYPGLYQTLFFNDPNSSTKTSLKGRNSRYNRHGSYRKPQ